MGKALAADLEKQTKILDDAVINGYVQRLTDKLRETSNIETPITAKVLATSEDRAVALPGGFLYISVGIISRMNTEAELASILAHEIAHITARHGTRTVSRGQIANLASTPIIFLGGWNGACTRANQGVLLPVGFLAQAREFEIEADQLAREYLANANYDPDGVTNAFRRLQSK